MKNLDYFLTFDHDARRRMTLSAVSAGALIGILSQWVGLGIPSAAVLCTAIIAGVEITSALLYRQSSPEGMTKKKQAFALFLHTKRSLVFAGVAALVFVAVSLVPVQRIEAGVVEYKLIANAAEPSDPRNIKETANVLAHAQAANIKLPASLVENSGKQFLKASEQTPDAWDAALAFASYRSTEITPASLPSLGPLHPALLPMIHGTVEESGTEMWEAGDVPPAESARAEPIEGPHKFDGTRGPQFIIVDFHGGPYELKSLHYKNVIIRNAAIHYSGQEIWLDKVYFLNCTFDFAATEASRALTAKVLGNPPVSFKNP